MFFKFLSSMSNGHKTNTHLTGLEGKMPEKELVQHVVQHKTMLILCVSSSPIEAELISTSQTLSVPGEEMTEPRAFAAQSKDR